MLWNSSRDAGSWKVPNRMKLADTRHTTAPGSSRTLPLRTKDRFRKAIEHGLCGRSGMLSCSASGRAPSIWLEQREAGSNLLCLSHPFCSVLTWLFKRLRDNRCLVSALIEHVSRDHVPSGDQAEGPCGGHPQRRHRLARDELAHAAAHDGAAVRRAAVGRRAGALRGKTSGSVIRRRVGGSFYAQTDSRRATVLKGHTIRRRR